MAAEKMEVPLFCKFKFLLEICDSSKIKDWDKTKISLHKPTEMMDEINKKTVLNAEPSLQQRKGIVDDKAAAITQSLNTKTGSEAA